VKRVCMRCFKGKDCLEVVNEVDENGDVIVLKVCKDCK
jgi:hypothetical protein